MKKLIAIVLLILAGMVAVCTAQEDYKQEFAKLPVDRQYDILKENVARLHVITTDSASRLDTIIQQFPFKGIGIEFKPGTSVKPTLSGKKLLHSTIFEVSSVWKDSQPLMWGLFLATSS